MADFQLSLFASRMIEQPWIRRKPRRARRNELLEVMRLTLSICRMQLNDYSCPKSRHTYTQPQLLACLVLRAYKKLTYRGVVELLEAADGLRAVLGLELVPAHTTLKAFSDRVLSPGMLDQTVSKLLQSLQDQGMKIDELALDSTGLASSSASTYFLSRAGRVCEGFIKLSLAVGCKRLVLVTMDLSIGPSNDLEQASTLLWRASARCKPDWILMDKGYDAEWVHAHCAAAGARSFIPPIPRSADGTIKGGPHRVRCSRHVPYNYGRRWHVESFISGLKRTCGSSLSARSQQALLTEAALRTLAYALRR